MGKSTDQGTVRAAELVDELAAQQKVLARAQARRAELMMEFSDRRSRCDRQVIAEAQATGHDARYKAGEFGATEIGLALRESKYSVQKVLGMARRLRAEAPDSWDAWLVGDINHDRAIRINRALRLLVRDESKQLLDHVVVDVAVCKTPELLGRWLNQFIARVEPDQTDERMRRSLTDRYVSVRPDVDGVSFMHAMVSSVDAVAIDQVLTAVAELAGPGDSRNLQQRRADALVDMLLGRISNGCATRWDTNSDAADDDEPVDEEGSDVLDVGGRTDVTADVYPDVSSQADGPGSDSAGNGELGADPNPNPNRNPEIGNSDDGDSDDGDPDDGDPDDRDNEASVAPEIDDWELPASAFRPDPPLAAVSAPGTGAARPTAGVGSVGGSPAKGITIRPVQVNIGIVVSAASLFGFTDTPGQLMDRSSLVAADTIRDLAAQPGTLFHRLITDECGNLLDVTELGRFPSRKLGLAISYRDGACTNPVCAVPAWRCDQDHVIPVPEGATTAGNLDEKCRPDHRAKTHAGHRTRRTGPHSGEWITPTGHRYETHDDPLPFERFPDTG